MRDTLRRLQNKKKRSKKEALRRRASGRARIPFYHQLCFAFLPSRGGTIQCAPPAGFRLCVELLLLFRGREGNKWYQRFPNPTACIENINNSNNKSRPHDIKSNQLKNNFMISRFTGNDARLSRRIVIAVVHAVAVAIFTFSIYAEFFEWAPLCYDAASRQRHARAAPDPPARSSRSNDDDDRHEWIIITMTLVLYDVECLEFAVFRTAADWCER